MNQVSPVTFVYYPLHVVHHYRRRTLLDPALRILLQQQLKYSTAGNRHQNVLDLVWLHRMKGPSLHLDNYRKGERRRCYAATLSYKLKTKNGYGSTIQYNRDALTKQQGKILMRCEAEELGRYNWF